MKSIVMKAPEGATSSNIEGHPYEVDEDGEIEVKNPNHVEILERHGYTVVGGDEEEAEASEGGDEDEDEDEQEEKPARRRRRRSRDRKRRSSDDED